MSDPQPSPEEPLAPDVDADLADAVATGGALGGMCCLATVGPPLVGLAIGAAFFGVAWALDLDLGTRREGKRTLLLVGVVLCLTWAAWSWWRAKRRTASGG